MNLLLALVIGGAVAAVAWATLDMIFSEERRVTRRLKTLSESERREAGEVEPLSTPFEQRILKPAGRYSVLLIRRLAPAGYTAELDVRCRTAGRPAGATGELVLAMQLMCGLTFALFGGLVATAVWGTRWTLLVALLGLIGGWMLPTAWLNGRVQARQNTIRRELPDMLDMLTITVEAGLGFDSAVSKYVQRQSGPLGEEFSVMLREIQAGMSRRDAMRGLAQRCNVPELSAFVMAMVQADVFGVSIGNVLRTQSHEMRLKRRQHAEEIAQKAPAKMVFPLILCVLPATLIVLMTPAIISIGRAFGMM